MKPESRVFQTQVCVQIGVGSVSGINALYNAAILFNPFEQLIAVISATNTTLSSFRIAIPLANALAVKNKV